MRRPLIVGNWKMNKTILEAISFVRAIKNSITYVTNVEILLCPAFTALYAVNNETKNSNINICAQNLFWETNGAFTGEISPIMVKDTGCSHVIIGHSERRQYFGDTNKIVNKKIKSAIEMDLMPIVCIGETLEEMESKITFEVIEKQIRECLVGLTCKSSFSIIIAYEPIWAIGTGRTATPDQIQEIHIFIRKIYAEMYGKAAEEIRILYGGSVNSYNISNLMRKSDIDGSLVGGASLEVECFIKLIEYFKKKNFVEG